MGAQPPRRKGPVGAAFAVVCCMLIVTIVQAQSSEDPKDEDGCSDITKPVPGEGLGYSQSDSKDRASRLALRDAKYMVCYNINRVADAFLNSSQGHCEPGCSRVEAWWEWCSIDSVSEATVECFESGTNEYDIHNDLVWDGLATKEWICRAEANATMNAHATCEPE